MPHALGTLPRELSIRWPDAPRIARDVTARTLDEALAAAGTAGTRVRVTGAIAGVIDVTASDVEIAFQPGASADGVFISDRLSRIAVRGGEVDHVEMELPAEYVGSSLVFHREWMTTDVLLQGVHANADDTAFLMRAGVRIAIVDCQSFAERYSVWFGDTADFESEDVIVAGNDLHSRHDEATVRLVHVRRSVTVDNRLENGFKHNYRTHGRSELNYAARNTLVNSGVMLGTMDGDAIGTQWLENNTFYSTLPSVLEVHLTSPRVELRTNTIYTDTWDCLLCRDLPAGWVETGNRILPYHAPPTGPAR